MLTEEKNVRAAELEKRGQTIAAHLENAMRFVRETFGAGQELLVLLTQLDTLPEARRFLQRGLRGAVRRGPAGADDEGAVDFETY